MDKGFFGSMHGLIVTCPTNIRYLTGFIGAAPEERESYVLLTPNRTTLFTSRLYRESAKRLTKAKRLSFVEINREHPLSEALSAITADEHIQRLGFEASDLTVAEYNKLRQSLSEVKLVPTQDRIEKVRMIKRRDEISHIRRAATLTDVCFTELKKLLVPGVSENTVVWEIERFFRQNGAGQAFSPIVAFGSHTSQPHYHNSPDEETLLAPSDIVLIDFGARIEGYCADMTRVVFVGTPKKEWVSAYGTVLAANEKALELLASGERNGATLDASAREVIAEAGLPVYPHTLGHAVGLDIHEAPRLRVQNAETLQPYMVITVEPGVYIEGSFGIRIEDLVLLTDQGVEVLSSSPKKITTSVLHVSG